VSDLAELLTVTRQQAPAGVTDVLAEDGTVDAALWVSVLARAPGDPANEED
jgi:hypothetical protein